MTTGKTNKRCIVSFANNAGRYVQNMARLSDSLRNNFDGDFIGFVGEASLGAPLHSEAPYEFKIHAIDKVKQQGYTSVIWLDSSVFAIGNVSPIFERLEDQGLVFQEAGHMLGTWSNDATLDYFGISRDAAMAMPMIGNAGFLGFDFTNHVANDFFNQWVQSMNANLFKGAWNNDNKTESQDERCRGHRHDMAASSSIVNQLGIFDLAYKGDEVLQYAGPYDQTLNSSIILKAQG